MRRTADKPWIRQALAAGAISLDRAEALSRIAENVSTLDHLDISGVRRKAADRVELTAADEIRSAEDRYLIMQPSLDESWWTLRGGLDVGDRRSPYTETTLDMCQCDKQVVNPLASARFWERV